ncbi:MAG: DUF427 domain-containing protein [Solirubrobacteraceae bacterium]|nr:DUF427 domain-containing protein [Solirubrobacteraceae bacterium]
MSLTLGTAPFAAQRAGVFNFDLAQSSPAHQIYFVPDPRRLRAIVGDVVVLDTVRAQLLYESNIPPRVYAPLEDYAMDAFTPTQTTSHCPFKGDASYWTFQAGEREIPDLLWAYPEPIAAAPFLAGHAALYGNKVDAWLVEDDHVFAHLRDPFHRVDVHDSSRGLVVRVGGEEILRAAQHKLLFETGLPPRAYVPAAAVAPGLVTPGSGKRTLCPYKGETTYWTVAGVTDAAWSYDAPLAEAGRIQSHLSFDTELEGVEVDIGGQP